MGALRFVFILVLLCMAYLLGARFGAPDWVLERFDAALERGVERTGNLGGRALAELEAEAEELRARFDRTHIYEDTLTSEVTVGDSEVIVAQPPALIVDRPTPTLVTANENSDAGATMHICLTSVSNAPPADDDLAIIGFQNEIRIEGVTLLTVPASNTCLSSGYGPRGASGRLHKGVDYFTKTGGDVLAAGDGTIVEATYRDDYGYMVVIDHGSGIYSRYAHLKRIDEPHTEGNRVSKGEVLGPIGNSGAYTDVTHLHFEVLQGEYDTPRKSFGLMPLNPYAALMP